MKKTVLRFLCILLIGYLTVALFLGGTDVYGFLKCYPWFRADSWYCETVGMYLDFPVNENGEQQHEITARLTGKGENQTFGVGFHGGYIMFYAESDENGISELVLEGDWHYRGEYLVVAVREDLLFGIDITELVFVPQ